MRAAAGGTRLDHLAGQAESLLYVGSLFFGQKGLFTALTGKEIEFLEYILPALLIQNALIILIDHVKTLGRANIYTGTAADTGR